MIQAPTVRVDDKSWLVDWTPTHAYFMNVITVFQYKAANMNQPNLELEAII